MLCYHALQGAAAAAAGQPRLIGAEVQSRAISHPEQFTYRPQPSPLKSPSLRRGWILGRKRDTSVLGLEVLLPSPDQEPEVEVEHKWIFPEADHCRKTGKEEGEGFLAVGSDVIVKSLKNGNDRYDILLEEDEIKDEPPILTKPKYVRGPDIDKKSFIRVYSISALRIPVAECWDLVFNLREHLLNWPRLSNIGRVSGDDVDEDLATVFVETSERKQSVTLYDVRAAVYADGETGMSRKKLAVDNDNRKCSSNQEVLNCPEAAIMLELEEEEEEEECEFEQEVTILADVANLNWSKKWIGPTRLLLLDEKYAGKEVSELPEALQAVYSRFGHLSPKSGLVSCRMTIFYEYWSMDEVLRELLPAEGHELVKFYRAGHVAELKLHPQHLPFRHLIAQVTLDKYKPTVRSVVVKRDRVDAKGYAVQLELLAGTTSLVTTAWENDIPFRIDMASANWDPRLSSERKRLVNSFSRSDVVCDLCAGVGPVAIPASKKVRRVYANEVNSYAHFYLASNVVDNQASGKIEVFNEDIQTFLRKVFYIERPLPITQLVMSHPLTTGEFLELLHGAFCRRTWPNASLPRIHLYGISRGIDPAESFSKEIAGVLQTTACKIRTNRVAKMTGGEWVVSASFSLPAHFGFS